MIQEAIGREPRIADGRGFIGRMCAVLLAARVALVAVEAAFVLANGLPIRLCATNFAMLLVAAVFVLAIYRMGVKGFAYLAMIGGPVTILTLMSDRFFADFQAGSALYKVYIVTLIASMLIQFLSMLLIVLNKNSKAYFLESKKIMKALSGRRSEAN